MKNRRRVYLARHGEVSYFESNPEPGDHDPPLNSVGVAQAAALGELLAESPLDLAVATGMRRTQQTAQHVIASRSLNIEVIEDLREARIGAFEGVETAEEIEALITGAFDGAEDPDARFLTGETYAGLWERVESAWRTLLARTDWSHAFVASHGVVNRTILAQSLGAGPQIYRRLEQDAGCLNVLDIDGEGDQARVAYVRLVNFTPYNAIKAGMYATTLESLWRHFIDG